MKPLAMLAGAFLLCCAPPAAAQSTDAPATDAPATDAPATDAPTKPASPCQARPAPNANGGSGAGQMGKTGDTGTATGQDPSTGNLTGTLDPCNGVLTPPPIGDSEMTEPAPDQGNTPVIKPGEIAPQQ